MRNIWKSYEVYKCAHINHSLTVLTKNVRSLQIKTNKAQRPCHLGAIVPFGEAQRSYEAICF